MMSNSPSAVLSETVWQADGPRVWFRRAALLVAGVLALAICAKVQLPVPGSPVPVTLGTFGLLAIGAAYGPRLGLATVVAYLATGALGVAVFAGDKAGLAYMMGGTGGYLLGYALAGAALGLLARRGWDRSVVWMALAMLVGNVLIYVPGLIWLRGFADGWAQTLAWGLTPFLVGDALKLALAAMVLPGLWKLVGAARG